MICEAVASDGGRFPDTEVFPVAAGRVQAVEVFFGGSLPHPAPGGGSLPGRAWRIPGRYPLAEPPGRA